jgi:ribonuclease HI
MGDAKLVFSQILEALAEDLDVEGVRRRFDLSREELADVLRETAKYLNPKIDHLGMWSLYVDGACRGNPGPAGAGAVLYGPKGEVQAEDSRYLGEATNNVAEYQALLLGLELALKHGVKNLFIYSDSELLVNQILGAYQVKKPHLYPLWLKARETLQNFDCYSLSHLDRSLNAEADRLARQAIDRQRRKR